MMNDGLKILALSFLSSVHHSAFRVHRSSLPHQTSDIIVKDQHDEGGDDQEPNAPSHLA